MKQYLDLAKDILENGARTGSDSRGLFGQQLRIDMTKGFPILSTRAVDFKRVVAELLWLLSGKTDVKQLNDSGYNHYNVFADVKGDVGPTVGTLWRAWNGSYRNTKHSDVVSRIPVDQVAEVKSAILADTGNRSMIMTSWDPDLLQMMQVPNILPLVQFFRVENKIYLNAYMHTGDVVQHLPYVIASQALLLAMMAHCTKTVPADLIITMGDIYIHHSHEVFLSEQLKRDPAGLPSLVLNQEVDTLSLFTSADISLENYTPAARIRLPAAV